MNRFNSSKYIFSPQRRSHGSGTYIVLPNRAYSDNILASMMRPLTALLNRVSTIQA